MHNTKIYFMHFPYWIKLILMLFYISVHMHKGKKAAYRNQIAKKKSVIVLTSTIEFISSNMCIKIIFEIDW